MGFDIPLSGTDLRLRKSEVRMRVLVFIKIGHVILAFVAIPR